MRRRQRQLELQRERDQAVALATDLLAALTRSAREYATPRDQALLMRAREVLARSAHPRES